MRNLQFIALLLLPCFMACRQGQEQDFLGFASTPAAAKLTGVSPLVPTTLLQSTDGGKTWQDISAGLPQDIKPTTFQAENNELFLGTSNGVYRNSAAAKSSPWQKDANLDNSYILASTGMGGAIAYSNKGRFLQRLDNTGVWMPILTSYEGTTASTVHATKDNSILISSGYGIVKSNDQGKTWRKVMNDGWASQIVESDGVLLCTNTKGILRSTDGGETWDVVLNEGGVGIDVTPIKGGFAAITFNAESEARHIHTSKDGGKTWQRIDEGLPPSKLISTIRQFGDSFFCGHPDGIFRSDDQGKSWFLAVPSDGKKVFNLSESNGIMYALLREGGC